MSTTKYKGKRYKRYKVKVIKTICECAGSIFFSCCFDLVDSIG